MLETESEESSSSSCDASDPQILLWSTFLLDFLFVASYLPCLDYHRHY